jgi:hypothetical protein
MTLTKFVRCLGPCPRESYGVHPQAQANIPCLGTPWQNKFYSKPHTQAHSFHGLFEIRYNHIAFKTWSPSPPQEYGRLLISQLVQPWCCDWLNKTICTWYKQQCDLWNEPIHDTSGRLVVFRHNWIQISIFLVLILERRFECLQENASNGPHQSISSSSGDACNENVELLHITIKGCVTVWPCKKRILRQKKT